MKEALCPTHPYGCPPPPVFAEGCLCDAGFTSSFHCWPIHLITLNACILVYKASYVVWARFIGRRRNRHPLIPNVKWSRRRRASVFLFDDWNIVFLQSSQIAQKLYKAIQSSINLKFLSVFASISQPPFIRECLCPLWSHTGLISTSYWKWKKHRIWLIVVFFLNILSENVTFWAVDSILVFTENISCNFPQCCINKGFLFYHFWYLSIHLDLFPFTWCSVLWIDRRSRHWSSALRHLWSWEAARSIWWHKVGSGRHKTDIRKKKKPYSNLNSLQPVSHSSSFPSWRISSSGRSQLKRE